VLRPGLPDWIGVVALGGEKFWVRIFERSASDGRKFLKRYALKISSDASDKFPSSVSPLLFLGPADTS
jgi:hypothetical protein